MFASMFAKFLGMSRMGMRKSSNAEARVDNETHQLLDVSIEGKCLARHLCNTTKFSLN